MPSNPPTSANDVKIILVTGGVVSGVGKGIVSSSLGVMLKAHGYRVTAIKIDPYINIDAGMFSPWEHGEVFVLEDGGEVDLDLGNYERFLNVCLSRDNNITTGKVYHRVIQLEREGRYLGRTVQVVPHITNCIRNWVEEVSQRPVDGTNLKPQVCIVELGGTAGDIESSPYMYSMAEFTRAEYKHRFLHVHVSMLTELPSGELKTKPIQQSVQTVCQFNLRPDLICCRSGRCITEKVRRKIADACRVEEGQVIGVHDVSNIYKVPLLLLEQGVLEQVEKSLGLVRPPEKKMNENSPNVHRWKQLASIADPDHFKDTVVIALVGKYFHLDQTADEERTSIFTDAYASVVKALHHAAIHSHRKLKILFVVSEHLEESADTKKKDQAFAMLKHADGILVPGGFGSRGVEGKIVACNFARVNNIPFLGICLGMQCAVIEFARNVIGVRHATSTEMVDASKTEENERVVIDMPEHMGGEGAQMGGTMRLGRRATVFLTKDSVMYKLYGKRDAIDERHRHRYEINPSLVPEYNKAGLHFVGMGMDDLTSAKTVSDLSIESQKILRLANKPNGGTDDFQAKVVDIVQEGKNTNTPVRMEIVELAEHPYYVGVQYHPEYTSHPLAPSPPFFGLLLAASKQLDKKNGRRQAWPLQRVDDKPASQLDPSFVFLASASNSSASLFAELRETETEKPSKEMSFSNLVGVEKLSENVTPAKFEV